MGIEGVGDKENLSVERPSNGSTSASLSHHVPSTGPPLSSHSFRAVPLRPSSPSIVHRILGINQEWEQLQGDKRLRAKGIYKALYLETLTYPERRSLAAKIVKGEPLPRGFARKGDTVRCPSGHELLLHAPSGAPEMRLNQADRAFKARLLGEMQFKGSKKIGDQDAARIVDFVENELKVNPEAFFRGASVRILSKEENALPYTLMIGKKRNGGINIYILKETLLGKGADKDVFLAIDYETGDEREPKFVVFASITKAENHPDTLPIKKELELIRQAYGKKELYAVQYNSKEADYVMPLATEGDAFDLVNEDTVWFQNTPEALQKRREIISSFVDVVASLHKNGIAVRDIKLENLLVTEAEGHYSAMINDFGLAASTKESAPVGSPEYLAPEAHPDYKGEKTGEMQDLYSLGITLWRLAVPPRLNLEKEGWTLLPDWIDDVLVGFPPMNRSIEAYQERYAETSKELNPLREIVRELTHPDLTKRPSAESIRMRLFNLPDSAFEVPEDELEEL